LRGVADQPLALVLVDDDVAGAQLLDVIVRAADSDETRMVEAVPDGRHPADNPSDFERHDILAQNCDDPVERADPSERAAAPPHRLRPGEVGEDPTKRVLDDLRRGSTRPLDDCEQDPVPLLKLVFREPGLAQKAFERLRRCGRAGTLDLLPAGLRLLRHVASNQRQPPRRRMDVDCARPEAGLVHLLREQPHEVVARPRLHTRRDFLGQKLKQKFGHQAG
jgi:hypothetical protein